MSIWIKISLNTITVISEITAKLKEKRGPNFFTDERFFGNLLPILETGKSKLIRKTAYRLPARGTESMTISIAALRMSC